MPKRMTSRWYVRNYVRIMDQGGDHSKKVISWKCFDGKWTGHLKFDVERPCYHHRFSLSLGFVKKNIRWIWKKNVRTCHDIIWYSSSSHHSPSIFLAVPWHRGLVRRDRQRSDKRLQRLASPLLRKWMMDIYVDYIMYIWYTLMSLI